MGSVWTLWQSISWFMLLTSLWWLNPFFSPPLTLLAYLPLLISDSSTCFHCGYSNRVATQLQLTQPAFSNFPLSKQQRHFTLHQQVQQQLPAATCPSDKLPSSHTWLLALVCLFLIVSYLTRAYYRHLPPCGAAAATSCNAWRRRTVL